MKSRPAADLGREALADGLDAVQLVKVHERALIAFMRAGVPTGGDADLIGSAARFFVDALTPFETARRMALKANGHLTRRNATMRREAVQLAALRRMLTRERGRRQSVQEALELSKSHYGELLARSGRMQEHLRRLSHEILQAHEDERKKISRELHDEVGQTLTAVNVKLASLNREAIVNTTGLKKKIASTQRLLKKSMNTVHRFARNLRPPLLDDLGLIPALHSYMKEFTKRTSLPIRFTASRAVERLSADKRTVLYRVAQEALTNVAKHAEADSVDVSMWKSRGIVHLEVHDDGKSFPIEQALSATRIKRLGLLGMRERVEMVGGIFAAESTPGKGTTVRVQIPLDRRRRGALGASVEASR